jgi:hypothetical protein
MGGGLGGSTTGGFGGTSTGGGLGSSGGGLGSSGGGLSSSGFTSGGAGSSFLGTSGGTTGGTGFLTSGYEPGTLGQAAKAGSKNPTSNGDLFARFFVNPMALGYTPSGSSSQTTTAFGLPLYATLYPGTQITSPFSAVTTASITSSRTSVMPGFTGTAGIGGLGGVSTRPAAAYTTVIGFKYRATPSGEFLANLGDVLARSSDLADTKIQLILDGPTVVLRGNVSDWEQRRLAENLLKLTPGVSVVKNELVVVQAPATSKAGQ